MTISESIVGHFKAAGWFSGRKMPVDPAVPADHPAFSVWREFGDLEVGVVGRGETCAASNISFRQSDFVDWFLEDWSEMKRRRPIGIANVHNGHEDLFIDLSGRCFGASTAHDAVYFFGASLNEAFEAIILGRKARPMLHPSQSEVSLYGDIYTADHPDIYNLDVHR